MAGSNNFIQWNPGSANQESDAAYAADTQRSGGATTGAVFASALANKVFYQSSTFIAALAAALAAKGYNMLDTVIGNLQVILANVLTVADMTFTNLVAWLGYTPVQQGTGIQQNTNAVKIGQDSTDATHVRCTTQSGVTSTDRGQLAIVGTDTMALPSSNLRLEMGGPVGAGSVSFSPAFSGTPRVFLGNIHGSVDIDDSSISASGFSLSVSSSSTACWLAIGPK